MSNADSSLRIVLADDHALVRGGLALMVKMVDEGVQIIEANDFGQTLECLAQDEPIDLLLLDLLMPGMNGAAGVRQICNNSPDVPVIVVSVEEDIAAIRQALEAGAMGYIPKTSSPQVTMGAIKLVLSGGVYIPPHVLRLTGSRRQAGEEQDVALEPVGAEECDAAFRLTSRQREVLELMARGKSNKAIASELGLTPGTVKMHTSRIFKSLDVENRTEAVAKYTKFRAIPEYS